jgi:hypothetical protein
VVESHQLLRTAAAPARHEAAQQLHQCRASGGICVVRWPWRLFDEVALNEREQKR